MEVLPPLWLNSPRSCYLTSKSNVFMSMTILKSSLSVRLLDNICRQSLGRLTFDCTLPNCFGRPFCRKALPTKGKQSPSSSGLIIHHPKQKMKHNMSLTCVSEGTTPHSKEVRGRRGHRFPQQSLGNLCRIPILPLLSAAYSAQKWYGMHF